MVWLCVSFLLGFRVSRAFVLSRVILAVGLVVFGWRCVMGVCPVVVLGVMYLSVVTSCVKVCRERAFNGDTSNVTP